MRIYKNRHSKANKLFRFIWNGVWLLLFRPSPVIGFNSFRIFLLRLFGANIGKGCRVFPSVKIWAPWNLELGNYTAIASHVDLYNVDQIKIGSYVTVSQYSYLCTASHDISELALPLIHAPIIIENYVWVCADCFIHKGITISEGSIISARANLYQSTPRFVIFSGNPAKKIATRKLKVTRNE
jgi:putative colanic acid biosynthesis acetyltransferase WcaF